MKYENNLVKYFVKYFRPKISWNFTTLLTPIREVQRRHWTWHKIIPPCWRYT